MQTQNAIRGLAVLALAMSLGLPLTGNAQTYKISFKGTCSGTNGDGAVFKQEVNNKTLIREWAGRTGATNFNNLRLVFHLNANGQGGDSIEVINKKTGEYVISVFPLMFPQSATQTTDKGVKEKRFALAYNVYDPGNVRGTSIVSQQMSFKNGGTNNFNLDGQILWYQSPGPDNTNWFRICNGKFNASGKPLVFQ